MNFWIPSEYLEYCQWIDLEVICMPKSTYLRDIENAAASQLLTFINNLMKSDGPHSIQDGFVLIGIRLGTF